MGRVLEQHAKAFLARHGLPVPAGEEAATPAGAAAAAERLGGRVVVKALVPANRRAQAGAVRFADDAAAAARAASELLGVVVAGNEAGARGRRRRSSGRPAAEPYRGTARFLELEGDIGLLCGGGGSLVLFDAVRRAGGRPACHTELGGNPSAEKVRGLARVVLSCPGVRGLLVAHNITNNTQVDLVARGVAAALDDLGLDPARFPVVAREIGTHDREGREICERAGIEYLGEEASLEDAARRIVERVGAAAGAA